MNRATLCINVVLLIAAALIPRDGCAQARGLSYWQGQEDGRHIESAAERRLVAEQQAQEQAEQERIELLDPAVRARKFEELHAFLRRLPGRFRIEGRVEGVLTVTIGGPSSSGPLSFGSVARSRKITGIADCAAIGAGVGLNCIMTATWPILEDPVGGRMAMSMPPPPSEALGTMRPAVLVLGLNEEPPGIRALMVTADTLAHQWTGKLVDTSAKLLRSSPCVGVRCHQMLEITSVPDSDLMSFVFRAGGLTMTITLHPDQHAELAKPVKPMKAR